MDRDLFLSILAMDSYNRGYGERIADLPSSIGTKIGHATITADNISTAAQDAGFYASAYDWNGEKIISYRGTDGNTVTDALNGYGIALGYASQPQGDLATEFYLNVTGQHVHALTAPDNVVVVGHSLGGGLAGLVSMLAGGEAIGFDYIPFASAANDNAIRNLEKVA